MPIFDFQCQSDPAHRFEAYLSRRENPDPACQECGGATRRLISRFAAIWTKSLSDYGDKNSETYYQDQKAGGHWVARKRSGGGTEDKPLREFITTPQQQRDYCKAEKLFNPSDIGSFSVDKSGEGTSSAGMPGAWI